MKARGETIGLSRLEIADAQERVMRAKRLKMLDDWSHKNEGTPETHDKAARVQQGALARMFMAGHITADQLGWAAEIGSVAELLEHDVAVRIVAYEPRIDCQASGRDVLVEGIMRVRREVAYGWWRDRIADPKRAVLDMLVGEPKAFSAVAKAYRIHKRRARSILIGAIDLWPDAKNFAEKSVDEGDLAAAHAGLI